MGDDWDLLGRLATVSNFGSDRTMSMAFWWGTTVGARGGQEGRFGGKILKSRNVFGALPDDETDLLGGPKGPGWCLVGKSRLSLAPLLGGFIHWL